MTEHLPAESHAVFSHSAAREEVKEVPQEVEKKTGVEEEEEKPAAPPRKEVTEEELEDWLDSMIS